MQTAPADKDVRDIVLREDLLGDCIAYVLSHEVGHTLSLMHNMAGSSSIPVESLRDPKFTQEFGTTYSIMDYARNNYVAQPGDKEKGVRNWELMITMLLPGCTLRYLRLKQLKKKFLYWTNGSAKSQEMINIVMVNNNSNAALTRVL